MRAPPHDIITPQKSCLQIASHWGLGFQHMGMGSGERALVCSTVCWIIVPYTKSFLVQSLARAHTTFAGWISGWGMYERQLIDVSLSHKCSSLSLSLFLSLKKENRRRGVPDIQSIASSLLENYSFGVFGGYIWQQGGKWESYFCGPEVWWLLWLERQWQKWWEVMRIWTCLVAKPKGLAGGMNVLQGKAKN